MSTQIEEVADLFGHRFQVQIPAFALSRWKVPTNLWIHDAVGAASLVGNTRNKVFPDGVSRKRKLSDMGPGMVLSRLAVGLDEMSPCVGRMAGK